MEENGKLNNVYIGALKLRNIKCFKGEHIIDFTDKDGKLFQWTVIMGNNNTGKTTILRALANLIPPTSVKGVRARRNLVALVYNKFVGDNEISSPVEAYIGFSLLLEKGKLGFSQKDFNNYYSKQADLFEIHDEKFIRLNQIHAFYEYELYGLNVHGYGINRRPGATTISDSKYGKNFSTLLDEKAELINAEEWLIQLDYAKKNDKKEAEIQLEKVKHLLTSDILPDVQDFRFTSDDDFDNYVEFQTDYGWVRLHELGYGYRSSIAWIVDLAKKMFERYPDSENPLAEAAVVLVDELDLHLHPEWQRKIISFLTNHFPNTQFIVTAHSPLIVQSAERVNIVLLNKEEDHVSISQPEIPTYKGWSVEEILSELMNLGERTHSDAYLQLMDDFENALDKEDFENAQKAYDQLSAILHPDSPQRKLLRMQMSAIVHD